jgi:fatty acid desaturase
VGFLLLVTATGAASWIAWEAAAAGAFPVWAVILVVFFHGMMWAFLLQGFHELVHYSVFKTRWLGTFFLYLYSFLGWFDPVHFKASHKRHHLYTLHPPKDREVMLPIRIPLWRYLRVAFVDPIGLYNRLKGFMLKAAGGYTNDWQREIFEEDGPKAQRKLRNWARFHLVGHAALVAAGALTGTWQLIVLITLAPFYGRWLEFLFNETQHVGLQDNVSDFRLCARTFTVNPVMRFLYWHMNYHVEHHMYAAVPCYNLHAMHRLIREQMPHCPHGVVATWRQIVAILRRKKEDPDYRYVPELPDEEKAPPTTSAGDGRNARYQSR